MAACLGVLSAVAVPAGAAAQAVSGSELTIYSSLPRAGPPMEAVVPIERGARLALRERGGKAGRYTVTYRALNSGTLDRFFDPRLVKKNARTAAEDPTAVGFIGEFNSAMSALAIPTLNRAGIAQVSPSNTDNGLTTAAPGAAKGEPGRHYPTGRRTYARIQPNDLVQARALATAAQEDGCASIHVFESGTRYSRGFARNLVDAAGSIGLRVRTTTRYDRRARSYRSVAKRVKAPCVVQTGEEEPAMRLLNAVGSLKRKARLYGSDYVCFDPTDGPWKVARDRYAKRFRCTIGTVFREGLGPEGQSFYERYSAAYPEPDPHPFAVYGYEAMALLLDSIERSAQAQQQPPQPGPGGYQDPLRAAQSSGDVSRSGVVGALFATRNRNSVLGTYGIDANGDTTLRNLGLYRLGRREIALDRVVVAR